jgi:hypothetical protein
MTPTIAPYVVLYAVLGVAFGVATYAQRHFFSEGGARPPARGGVLEGRIVWCVVCSGLWPLFVVTGAWNLVRLSQARARRSRP